MSTTSYRPSFRLNGGGDLHEDAARQEARDPGMPIAASRNAWWLRRTAVLAKMPLGTLSGDDLRQLVTLLNRARGVN